MDANLQKRLMGLVDSHGMQSIMARGRTRYNGPGQSPNPLGFNGKRAAKLLLKRRKNNGNTR